MPALPLDEAGQYVAAAYAVFVVLLIVYVGIMAVRLGRISKEIESIAELAEKREAERNPAGPEAGVADSGSGEDADPGGRKTEEVRA